MKKSSKAMLVALATASLAIGGLVPAQAATGSLQICKNTTSGWISLKTKCFTTDVRITNISALIGPAGAAGATGPAGVAGPAGANGVDGAAGPAGPAGANGVDGINGVDGAPGAPGADGAAGVDGADGNDGATGADGADGAAGADGADGNDGAPGADGADGLGLTNASIGVACSVDEDADPLTPDLNGTYQWAETSTGSQQYLMVCNTI
ncbi:MAG: hypothetical protein RL716_1257 [Actinomycetota bacterium]